MVNGLREGGGEVKGEVVVCIGKLMERERERANFLSEGKGKRRERGQQVSWRQVK